MHSLPLILTVCGFCFTAGFCVGIGFALRYLERRGLAFLEAQGEPGRKQDMHGAATE